MSRAVHARPRHRLIAILACAAAVAGVGAGGAAAAGAAAGAGAAGSHTCANAHVAATASNLKRMRAAVLCLVNHQRTSRGLPALREDTRLDRAAQGWSSHMVATHQFTHGHNFAGRISAQGYNWSAAGENIATGYPDPSSVVAGWMASAGHCRNILDPSFRAIGIGMVARPVTGYASGPATWTQDFGLAMGVKPPSHKYGPRNGCPY